MKKDIPYLQWRKNIENITPQDHRIADDILLIDSFLISDIVAGPYKTDVTTAIIYLQGSATVLVDMKEYTIKAPCVFVMLADQILQHKSISSDCVTKIIIMSKRFSNNLFANVRETYPLYISLYQSPIILFSENEKIVLEQYYNSVLNIIQFSENPYRLETIKHLTLALFYGYVYRKHEIIQKKNSRKDELSDKFFEILRKHYKNEHKVGFYADKMCITPKYLSKIIKESSGKSAAEWIDEYIITESKALLRSSNMTIQQICDEMNFFSSSLFGKFFKRVVGISPTNYRKNG